MDENRKEDTLATVAEAFEWLLSCCYFECEFIDCCQVECCYFDLIIEILRSVASVERESHPP